MRKMRRGHPIEVIQPLRHAYAGVHVIWSNDTYALTTQFIKGGQTVINWADIEQTQGVYDWSVLRNELATYAAGNKPTTIWLNAPAKPAWVYQLNGVRSVGSYTKGGNTWDIITYWKPSFMSALQNLFLALGEELRRSPYQKYVLGLRGSPELIGTEQFDLTDPQATITDSSVFNEWDRALGIRCYTDVMRYHNAALLPENHAFLRSVLFTGLDTSAALRSELIGNDKGWLHAVDPDPDAPNTSVDTFYFNYVKSGSTIGYYEALPAASKTHPLSWMYWRHLHDLHRGISYIVSYDNDLLNATNGALQSEYQSIFDFANTYAGFDASNSSASPGAWIAFRGGASTQINNSNYISLYNADGSLGGDSSTVALDSNNGSNIIGSSSQRYGRYARRTDVASGKKSFYLRLDSTFKSSLTGLVIVYVTYLNSGNGSWVLTVGNTSQQQSFAKTNSNTWEKVSLTVLASTLSNSLSGSSDILLSVSTTDTTFHMVEVQRT